MEEFKLPSVVQKLESSFLQEKGIELFMKRDDLIHPIVSGNKWRKLKFNFKQAKSEGKTELITFGGAFSNHIAATAYAGKLLGFKTHGIIRGERVKPLNQTLSLAKSWGMQLSFVSRSEYRKKAEQDYLKDLQNENPMALIVPEGGANIKGVEGCKEIVKELEQDYDLITVAAGTGTTAAGILSSISNQKLMVFPALKGANQLKHDILSYEVNRQQAEKLIWNNHYHFGGYAKLSGQLVDFVNQFYKTYQIPLDLIYNGKMMFGLFDLIGKGHFPKGSKILCIHTGGLQGNAGLEQRYGFQLDFH